MNSPVRPNARMLLELAGLSLPAEREAFLAAGLDSSTRPIAEALARRDYGEAEPASRFRPPANESR